MAHLSKQLLPSSTFQHIGVMVFFMSFVACLCALGFLFVKDITGKWIIDIEHSLTIEIPSYSIEEEKIFDANHISKLSEKIRLALGDDPAITHLKIEKITSNNIMDDFDIPLPVFIEITLHEQRSDNTEDRLRKKIARTVPVAIVKTNEEWQSSILAVATRLKMVFSALTLCVFIVSAMIIGAIISAQLKASQKNIELFHLMGATPSKIASLFQVSILRPVLWGSAFGNTIVFLCLSKLALLYDIGFSLIDFYICVAAITVCFITLGWGVTRWVVLKSLWAMA